MMKITAVVLLGSALVYATAQDNTPIHGKWKVHSSIAGNDRDTSCTFVQSGKELTGTCAAGTGGANITGAVDGKKVSWSYDMQYNGSPLTMKYEGALDAETITGKVTVVQVDVGGDFTATAWSEADNARFASNTQNSASKQIGTGPFPATMESDPGLPTHTVYRPADLTAFGSQKLPIIAWGNGACYNYGNLFRNFLSEIASYGFLAIAVGPSKSLDTVPAMVQPGAGKPGAPQPANGESRGQLVLGSKASQLIDAINWAVAENSRKDSQYFGKLDTAEIAVMGQSCGGMQAIAVSGDPRIKLTVAWNSGVYTAPAPQRETAGPGGQDLSKLLSFVNKDSLKKLHSPIFYFTGDKASDIAYPWAMDDFNLVDNVPVFYAYKDGTPHNASYLEPNGGEMGKIAVALLMWQLKGDQQASKTFVGSDCILCRESKWHVLKRRMN